MKKIIVLLPIIVIACWVFAIGVIPEVAQGQPPGGPPGGPPVPGPPLDYLQQQIDELKVQLDEIQSVPSGGVLVRDDNDQLLGTLVDTENAGDMIWPSTELILFVKDLSLLIAIDEDTGNVASRPLTELYYREANCGGEPYAMSWTPQRYNTIYHSREDDMGPGPAIDMYYYAVPPYSGVDGIQVWSYFTVNPTPHCDEINGYYIMGYRIIEVPGEQIDITLPVALPLHYGSQ
jgi:hypothetical protein